MGWVVRLEWRLTGEVEWYSPQGGRKDRAEAMVFPTEYKAASIAHQSQAMNGTYRLRTVVEPV